MSPVTNELVSYAKSRPQKFGPIQVDEVDLGDNEIDLFRNVHYTEIRDAIASVDEAREILEDSPGDSSALRYLGAWSMSPSNYSRSITSAIIFLENAVEMGMLRKVFQTFANNSKNPGMWKVGIY